MGDNSEAALLQPEAGGEITRPGSEAAAARTLGEAPISPEQHSAENRREQRRAMFDTIGDKALTFAEGAIDAVSLGLLHEHGEAADIRRDVNSGSALLGQIVGIAGSLETGGPVKFFAGAGKKIGADAAKALLGTVEEGSRGAVVTRALEAAGENAAIMGAGAFGHELSDAVVEDKPFSGEVVLHEIGLGAALGGTFGLMSGAFSRVASRGAVEAQGGLAAGEGLGTHVKDAITGLDSAVETHAQRLGVLEVLANDGHLSDDFMAGRRALLERAQSAQERLSGFDPDEALKSDPKNYLKFREALDTYQESVSALDEAMRPRMLETAQRSRLGRPEDVPGYGQEPLGVEDIVPEGHVMKGNQELVRAMSADPAAQARYQEMWGKDFWEGAEGAEAFKPEAEQMVARGPEEGAATPVDRTNAGSARARAATPAEPAVSEGRLSPNTQAIAEGRRISPSAEAIERNNVLSSDHPDLARSQVLLPDGYFMPARQAEDVGNAFSRFQDKVLDDTLAQRARKAQSLENFRAKQAANPVGEVVSDGVPKDTMVGSRPVKAGRDTLIDEVPEGRLAGALAKDAETARTGVQSTKSAPPVEEAPQSRALKPKPRTVSQYLDDWQADSRKLGPRISPGDKANAQITDSLRQLHDLSAGRFDSASTLELAEKLGVSGASTPLGETLDQAWTIRQAGQMAADESRGVKTPLRGSAKSHVMDWLKRRAAGKVGAAVAGGIIGDKIGGPAGYFVGAALAAKYMNFGGRMAAAAGRTYQKTVAAAASLLKGSRTTIAARAVAGNRPYQYSDRGAIKDPVERIQEIQQLAAQPEEIKARITKSLGDLPVMHPELAQAAIDRGVAQVQRLAVKAPAIYFNQLGEAMPPAAGALRNFLEYENATHSYETVLNAVSNGSVTRTQADALREQWPEVHAKLAQSLLADQDGLRGIQRAKLRTIEMITGYPLTAGSDPSFIARQQAAWLSPTGSPQRAGKAQSFKITAPAPTPAQAQARAPGN